MAQSLGLIETMRVRAGSVPLWDLHRDRLAASATALGLPLPPLTPPTGGADRILRWLLSRSGLTVTERAAALGGGPLRLHPARSPHPQYPHKTTDRAAFDQAAAEAARAGADEALLLTTDGVVAEAAHWGVYWWEGEDLCAPPLALGILPSVARRRLVDGLGVALMERRVTPADLRGRPLFVANAARGVVPAVLLGDSVVVEPRVAHLAAVFWP